MKKPRKYYDIVENKDNSKEVDFVLFGVIGNKWDDLHLVAKGFRIDFLEAEKKFDRINIRINSPGGIVEEGLPIFNIIQQSKKDVHAYIDGVAFSMAAIISQSVKKGNVHSAKNSIFMLHAVSTFTGGNAKDLRDEADVLDLYDSSLILSIAERSDKTVGDLKAKYFDYKDHFMSAEQAKTAGFIDVIEDYTATNVPDNLSNLEPQAILAYYENEDNQNSFFKNIYDAAARRVAALFNSKDSEMDKAQAIVLLNAKDALTEDQRKQITDLLNDVSVSDHKKVNDTLTGIVDAIGDDAKKEGANVVDLVKNLVANLGTVKKVVENIRVAMGGKAEDTTDLVAICKEQKEKADKSTNNRSDGHKNTNDEFEDAKENSYDQAPWNQKVRSRYKKPEQK